MKITASSYRRMPEALWRRLRALLPKRRPHPHGGRPSLDLRRVADGIYFVLRTGCPWKAAPAEFGSGSSLHRYFQQWCQHGVFRRLWQEGLAAYERRRGIAWRWFSLDATMTKAPLGGEKNRAQSHGSREVGSQAVGADGRPRRRVGSGNRSREPARPEAGPADARQHAGPSPPAATASAAALVRRQGVSFPCLSQEVGAAPVPSAHPRARRGGGAATSSPTRPAATLGQ